MLSDIEKDFILDQLHSIKVVSPYYLKRYIRIIFNSYGKYDNCGIYCEKHHILPQSLFPKFKNLKKFKFNCIKVPLQLHFILHWILAKAYEGKMRYAFSGFKMFLDEMKIQGYSKEDIYRWVMRASKSKNKHSEETKYNIGCGLRGKIAYSNELGEVKFFEDSETAIKSGFLLKGHASLKNMKNSLGYNWYNNPISGECIRIKEGTDIPYGFVQGRTFKENTGFKKVNDKNVSTYFDVKKKKYVCIEKCVYDKDIHFTHGGKNTSIIVIDDIFAIQKNMVKQVFGYNPFPYLKGKEQLSFKYLPSVNTTKEKLSLFLKYGKVTYGDLGCRTITHEEYINSDLYLTVLNSPTQAKEIMERFLVYEYI